MRGFFSPLLASTPLLNKSLPGACFIMLYTGCVKKAERSIFVTLLCENIAYLISPDETWSSKKNDTKIMEIVE